MAPLPCTKAFMINYASNMSVTVNANCYLRQGLLNGSIDSLRIATEDCQVTNCKSLITEIYVFTSSDCTFVESQTGNQWQWTNLYKFCDIPVATTTTATSRLPTTSAPSSFKPVTRAPISTSSSSGDSMPPFTIWPDGSITLTSEPTWFESNKAVVIGVSVGVLLLLTLVVFFCRRNQQQRATDIPTQVPYAPVQDIATQQVQRSNNLNSHQPPKGSYPSTMATGTTTATGNKTSSASMIPDGVLDMCGLDMHRIASNEVRPVQAIAQGAYGEVWLGQYLGQKVAMKKLLTIHSPYVVQFVGVTWTKPADMALVTEYMAGGDLRGVLVANSSAQSFTWHHKVQCALHIAEGLVYLHTMDPKVIHRDLKSRNVLLDADFNAKITDFGIARETDDATMTAGIGTYRWMAPEVLMDGHYSELADLFSFGVILSELSTELVPYSDLRNGAGNAFTDTAIMAKVMIGQLQPSFAPDCPAWFATLARECLALSPAVRPSAMQAAYRLRLHVESNTRCINGY
ncbi:hypothetical protein DYB38_007130 [Aphanomyces astaci]|uniref:Protein kinase domain-containing protein n=1 Tax=Aphanomyces astaci TaxID=112090 RepID=A0A397CIU9_APHAT|nr:hypothetical protein DYB38_007130 [Aphanomyces astaci]